MSDHENLNDREIDALVAERIFHIKGIENSGGLWLYDRGEERVHVPHYSTDDNLARVVRGMMTQLALVGQFLDALPISLREDARGLEALGIIPQFQWISMQATPRQQCIAALQAINGSTR
jgi:hypothetical protein